MHTIVEDWLPLTDNYLLVKMLRRLKWNSYFIMYYHLTQYKYRVFVIKMSCIVLHLYFSIGMDT